MDYRDERGLFMGSTTQNGQTIQVRNAQGLLLGTVENGKTFQANGYYLGEGDLSSYLIHEDYEK